MCSYKLLSGARSEREHFRFHVRDHASSLFLQPCLWAFKQPCFRIPTLHHLSLHFKSLLVKGAGRVASALALKGFILLTELKLDQTQVANRLKRKKQTIAYTSTLLLVNLQCDAFISVEFVDCNIFGNRFIINREHTVA